VNNASNLGVQLKKLKSPLNTMRGLPISPLLPASSSDALSRMAERAKGLPYIPPMMKAVDASMSLTEEARR